MLRPSAGLACEVAASIPPPGSLLTAQGQQDEFAFQSLKALKHRHGREQTQYFTAQGRENGMKMASSSKSILERRSNK